MAKVRRSVSGVQIRNLNSRNRQGGAALYLLLVFILLAGSPFLYSVTKTRPPSKYDDSLLNRMALKQARENLLAMAVNYAGNYGPLGSGPGHFPCPNKNLPDGSRSSEGPSPPCGGQAVVSGRLPKLTSVDFNNGTVNYQTGFYDSNTAFWYFLSGSFVNNPLSTSTIVNPSSKANLKLNGEEGIVAVLVDTGHAMPHQVQFRPSVNLNHYLEVANADGDADYLSGLAHSSNDSLIGIRADRLIRLVNRRVLAHTAEWLRVYQEGRCGELVTEKESPCYPMAAPEPGDCSPESREGWIAINPGTCESSLFSGLLFENAERDRHWFIRNDWYRYVRYSISEGCEMPLANCVPVAETAVLGNTEFPLIRITQVDAK